MSYRVSGGWQETFDEEYDELNDALEVARDLAQAHATGGFTVSGPGFSASLVAVEEEVSA